MSEYAILLTALLTSVAVVGGLILGAIYFFYNAIKSDIALLRSDIAAVDAKVDRVRVELDAKIEREVNGLRSEMQEGFARLDAKLDTKADNLDAKIDTKTDDLHAKLDAKIEREVSSLRSDLGGRIDANTQKLAELATEVQVHLRTHHLMREIERLNAPPESQSEEEQVVEEANPAI
jgi:F0F1-type ATP synthase membrane subunit b/b'